ASRFAHGNGATGPSTARTMSPNVTAAAVPRNTYPPAFPRMLCTNPALFNASNTCSRNFFGIPSRRAISWMDNIAGASGAARHTKARMAYSLFLESFIIPTYLLEIKTTRDPKLLKISKNIALDRTLQGRIIPMFPIISIDLIDIKERLRMSQVQE